jgi:hypothetical protein
MHDHCRMAPIFDRLVAKGVDELSYEAVHLSLQLTHLSYSLCEL